MCSDSGAVLLLKAVCTNRLFFYCPLCGVAWRDAPKGNRLDEIEPLETFAPDGVSLPTLLEARATGVALVEMDLGEWGSMLGPIIKN